MIIRICIGIPCYNNPKTVLDVVRGCLAETPFPIIVYDDGSEVSVLTLLEKELFAELSAGRVKVLRSEKNLGKGHALKQLFDKALKSSYTHLISIDADGQHPPREIRKLVKEVKENPHQLVIAKRDFQNSEAPPVSRFGRKFSNFWVRYQTELPVEDSQSGFRSYPLFYVQNFRFLTRKFDFEIEILVRLLWKKVPMKEVLVDVIYDPVERVSHFHKFWDNLRISLLNTCFVALSLMRKPQNRMSFAFSLALGVFIGCTPLYGLHSFVVIGVAVLIRQNVLLMLLGSQISLPPFVPLLVASSVALGKKFLSPEYSHLSVYMLGSTLLGLILALVTFILSYLLCFRMGKKDSSRKKRAWNGKQRGGRFGNAFLKFVMNYLGRSPVQFLLFFIVPYFLLFAPKGRRALHEYWSILKPELGYLGRTTRILRHFYVFASVLLDRMFQSLKNVEYSIETREQALIKDTEGGAILLSSHIGAWDIAAQSLSKRYGFEKKVHILRYAAEGMKFEDLRKTEEEEQRVETLYVNENTLPLIDIHRVLSRGEMVGMMGDRSMGASYEWVLFFGKLVPIDTTAYRVAALSSSPIIINFGLRNGVASYSFYATRKFHVQKKQKQDQQFEALSFAQAYTQEMEKILKKDPFQWFNFYSFWSERPLAEEGMLENKERCYLKEELEGSIAPGFGLGASACKNIETQRSS